MQPQTTIAIADGLRVGRLGLGTMSLTGPGTWGPPADPGAAVELLRRARELGVTLFDTADSYGPGVAEMLVADAFGPTYDGVVVATKAGLTRQGPGRWDCDGRPEHLRAACEGSLRRLGSERIDLFQLHAVDPTVPLEESLGALVELRAEGKIRHIGICNVDRRQLERALTCAPVVSVQNRFSLAEREWDGVLAECERLNLAFLAWAPLAKGALAGSGGRLRSLADALDATPGQVALAWLLHYSPAAVPIPGTSSIGHLSENVAASTLELTPGQVGELERQLLLGYRARRLKRRARIRASALRHLVARQAGR